MLVPTVDKLFGRVNVYFDTACGSTFVLFQVTDGEIKDWPTSNITELEPFNLK